MSEPVYGKMTITSLLLNPENPRFDPVKHQMDAIRAMIDEQQDKLVALAEHIAEHGLNPAAPILVKPYVDDDKQWVVREGNRRITALKLINQPSLVPDDYPKVKKEFQRLSAPFDMGLLQSIPCVVLENEDQINEWVSLAHTGENNGMGTVRWNGQQTSRFKAMVAGKPDPRLAFLEELKCCPTIPKTLKDKFRDIQKTNFDRLMDDPAVRIALGVDLVEGKLKLLGEVTPFLLKALTDLADGRLNVGKIYYKANRADYIGSLSQTDTVHTSSPNSAQPASGVDSLSDPANPAVDPVISSSSAESAAARDNPVTLASYQINRDTLVPRQQALTISKPRVLKIFKELRFIKVGDFPNAVAVLFRTFIELSADYYLSQHGIVIGEKQDEERKLGSKINAMADHMEQQNIMKKNELHAARQMASSPTQNHSVKTFHAYVHNVDLTPVPTDLKTAWDDMWTFVQHIWM